MAIKATLRGPAATGDGPGIGRDLRFPAIVAGFGLSLLAPGRLAGPAAFVLGLAPVWRSPGPLRALVHAAAAAGLSCLIFDTLVSQPWPDPWVLRLLPRGRQPSVRQPAIVSAIPVNSAA